MSYFRSLELRGWRQFEEVNLDLGQRVTIITGSNGCGKTTILSLLSRHFGWNIPFASSPYISKRSAKTIYRDIHHQYEMFEIEPNRQVEVGMIVYDDGNVCGLSVPAQVGANYQVTMQNQVNRPGLFIPSHRQQSVYNQISTIPTNPVNAAQMYEQFRGIAAQLYQGARIGGNQKNPGAVQKESLISLAIFGEGNNSIEENVEYRDIFYSFQERLQIVLPPEIGFQSIKVRMPDVVLQTASGDFSLDAMSGGVASLFSIAWQIHMFDVSQEQYTIVIDEPENHLHPSMQRSMLPALAKAFPRARFVVATHSPFVVSSFRESSIHMLTHNERNRVVSERLDETNVSGSANQILKEILGVESTLPLWVQDVISSQLDANNGLSPDEKASKIMDLLRQLGITEAISEYKKK